VPGVRRVALSSGLPGQSGTTALQIEGRTDASESERPSVQRLVVSPGFFDTLRVTPIRGRLLSRADTAEAPKVIVVDAALAAKFFPGEDPLGRRVILGSDAKAEPWTIVGVIPTLAAPQRQEQAVVEGVYVPMAQSPMRGAMVLASTTGSAETLTPGIRQAAREVDPDLPISPINGSHAMATMLDQRNWPVRVFGGLFTSFGVAALLLASAGLYGVMAFSVRRRTQEIGVRLALGASRGSIVRMVVWEGLWRVALGIALGLVPAYFLGGLMEALFFRVTQGDPVVFGLTILALLLAGFTASAVPAVRAASVNPLIALKE
jgi:putative ABC transport system permease protein